MTSDRQIAANRANSLLSTGPVTEAGIEASSRNSTRHGLLATTLVLEGESHERFQLLLTGLQEKFQPTDLVESCLVETMAVARWRLMRLWAVEKASITRHMENASGDSGTESELDPPNRAALAFESLTDQSRMLEVMGRHEARFDRQFNRAMERLMKLRKEK